MSPEQLLTLQKLSRQFEEGVAGPTQVRQLSELLSTINCHNESIEEHVDKLVRSDITEQV
ncbi:hypothetical protein [Thalassotalea sp. G2M2-11]|uniref:hypothetical protein n=1 Tax=Thalassotalea sp. G2M2-11 TaxID=2787627 RepID=UPI0019D0251B|nr:hypothetical protein [Thalassotalea sp. G2M2-11]